MGGALPPPIDEVDEILSEVWAMIATGTREDHKALTSVLVGPTIVEGRHSIQPSFIVPTQKVRVLSRVVRLAGIEPAASSKRRDRLHVAQFRQGEKGMCSTHAPRADSGSASRDNTPDNFSGTQRRRRTTLPVGSPALGPTGSLSQASSPTSASVGVLPLSSRSH